MESIDLKKILSELPPIFPRKDTPKYLPGLFSRGHLQNLEYLGLGLTSIVIGRIVCYERESFIAWLESRVVRKNKVAGRV